MESLGKNRLTHRKITSITLALLLGAGGIAALPPTALASTTCGVASSERSFPAVDTVRRDPTRESVATTADGTWEGIESLNVPVTESQAEKDARLKAEQARKTAAAQATRPQAQPEAAGRGETRTTITPPASRTGRAVAEYSLQFAGYPYVYGGSQPTGWDCSGFVMYVFAQFGISLPHSSGAQMTVGSPVASLADAQPGDILANPSHAAIYVGNGMVMNAMSPAQGTGLAPVGTVMGASYAIRRIV